MRAGRVVVTGATGFVGRALVPVLTASGWDVVPAGRAEVGDIDARTDWPAFFAGPGQGAIAVVHLAARAHVMSDRAADPLYEYRRINTDGTVRLARESARAGVRRLVFVSSVKVMGEETELPYSEAMAPAPADPYGVSKWEAEQKLTEIARETGLDVTTLRPPLVYGPGVRANFLSLIRAVDRGLPLPLGSIRNRRSMIYVGNLCGAIRAVLSDRRETPACRAFLLSDGSPVSTPELIRKIADALGRSARLIPVSPGLLRFAGRMTGKSQAVRRLLGSIEIDDRKIRQELDWTPSHSLEAGLRETVKWYQSSS